MPKNIYDNSNITESYSGCTTPLTFSFISHVYEGVYRHFCRMMGVKEKQIVRHHYMFANMLGFIGYRVYYNLGNWYQMLSFFPGYKFSSRFMEKMMGVKKQHALERKSDYLYLPRAAYSALKIVASFSTLGIRSKRFNSCFDRTYREINSLNLSGLNMEALKDIYLDLNSKLIEKWKVPIANDFAVMVSTGLTDLLFQKWLNSESAYDYISLMNNKSLSTLDPGNKIRKISDEIKNDKKLHEVFTGNFSNKDIWLTLSNQYKKTKTFELINHYLESFSCRMPNELKLESETLDEKPYLLIGILSLFIKGDHHGDASKNKISTRIKLPFFKKHFLFWLLKWSGNSIHRREDSRFRRTLIFGVARKIFLSIGKILQEKEVVVEKRDIFFLTTEELFSYGIDYKKIIAKRKAEYEAWSKTKIPSRIETCKTIEVLERELIKSQATDSTEEVTLKGRPASKPEGMSKISGTILILKEFDINADFNDKILITRQTDPGWTIIFSLLKGIVVERGGMLSHAAIVARELGIPCIVGAERATDFFENGTMVTMDLDSGTIEKNIK